VVGNLLIQGIVQVGKGHQSLDGEENRSDLKSWRPLVLQDIETDSTKLVDIWVIDLGSEKNLWWDHWVFFWKEEFTIEDTALIRGLSWAYNLDEEMSWVLLIWLSVDTNNWVLSKSLCFL